VKKLQRLGRKKHIERLTMTDFLAAPFLLMANLCLWIASLITGNYMILIEVTDDNEEDEEDKPDGKES